MAIGTDQYYLAKMRDILFTYPTEPPPKQPSQLLDYLYIGGYSDAENIQLLRRLGITHVLNCAAWQESATSPYPQSSGITGYEQFSAYDDEHYDIMQHWPRARAFIERARKTGGKCLVHCAMGVNRSGAICAAYLMTSQQMDLLQTVRHLRAKRGVVLCNKGFQRQIVTFARKNTHLRLNHIRQPRR